MEQKWSILAICFNVSITCSSKFGGYDLKVGQFSFADVDHFTPVANIRPIYHFKPERVEAHILLCYLAFSLIRYAEYRIELWRTQASILKDHKTNKSYRVPSKTSEIAQKLYQTFGLVRNERICSIETT